MANYRSFWSCPEWRDPVFVNYSNTPTQTPKRIGFPAYHLYDKVEKLELCTKVGVGLLPQTCRGNNIKLRIVCWWLTEHGQFFQIFFLPNLPSQCINHPDWQFLQCHPKTWATNRYFEKHKPRSHPSIWERFQIKILVFRLLWR